MNVSDAIRSKRAIRNFRDETLAEDHLRAILDAGRRSQSSKNSQPWHFIAVQERSRLEAIAALGANLGHAAGSALCVVIVIPQDNERSIWHYFDTGPGRRLHAAGGPGTGRRFLPRHGLRAGCPARDSRLSAGVAGAPCLSPSGYPAAQQPRPGLGAAGRRRYAEVVHRETWGG